MSDTQHEDPVSTATGAGTRTAPTTSATSTPSLTGPDTEARPRTRDVAAEEAAGVAHDAKDAAVDVARTAKDEAGAVADEAKDQARRLYDEGRNELTAQAATQQSRAASGLSALGDELRQMADRSDGGVATDLARQGAERVDSAAAWLRDREPGEVVDDLSRWARQRPGTFLAAAAAVGLVAGRLTRGLADEARDDDEADDVGAGHRQAAAKERPHSTSQAVPSRTGSAAHPLASEDLPPAAADPTDRSKAADDALADRGRE